MLRHFELPLSVLTSPPHQDLFFDKPVLNQTYDSLVTYQLSPLNSALLQDGLAIFYERSLKKYLAEEIVKCNDDATKLPRPLLSIPHSC